MSGKLCEENGIHTSGKKVKHQSLLEKCQNCKCDNFVLIVVFGGSSEAHLATSAD